MSTPQGEAGVSSPVCSAVVSVCDASSDVCLGDDIWRTGCCPCSTSPLSTSLIDPKEQRNCYSLAPVPSQELPERGCRQQRTALGAPTPDFSSRFTPEAFSMTGYGRKAAEV